MFPVKKDATMEELDNKIIRAAADGEKKAFKMLYDHYSTMVWRVVFKTVHGDRIAAEEIAQEVFVKVFRSLKTFRGDAAFSTWLYRLTYTTTMSWLTRNKRQQMHIVTFDDELAIPTGNQAPDLREQVARILAALTAEERFLLVAREVDDLSYDDLAVITGSAAGALRTRLHRLKQTIRTEADHEKD
jgi:RNA polymerase sigma-70 factor (ECF subfamily)